MVAAFTAKMFLNTFSYIRIFGRELADMMERRKGRKVDILCVQETKWKGSKARNIRGSYGQKNGVGIILKEWFINSVLEVRRVSDRAMCMKLEIEGVLFNVISAYAPQVGCNTEEKEEFWNELMKKCRRYQEQREWWLALT